MEDGEENKNDDILGAKEDDYQERPAQAQKRAADDLNLGFAAKDVKEGRASLPRMVRLICNEKHIQLMEPTSGDQILNRNLKNAYAEQERSVLSSFLDFLEKLIISKNMKVRFPCLISSINLIDTKCYVRTCNYILIEQHILCKMTV